MIRFLFAVLVLRTVFAGPCETLASLEMPRATVASAKLLEGDAVPASCRIAIVAKPVPDSEIHIEIWLPAPATWNGKFLGTGNGGYSSGLSTRQMEAALRIGYAVAGSDTGHTGGELIFGAGHPEKINDWAWRAVHVMTETAQQIVRAYYGRSATHSYFSGCSTGGQQALTEAQRFPGDYDGIVAGAPGIDRIHLNAGFLWNWRALHTKGENLLPASKLHVLHSAVLSACEAMDGRKDGVISDPRRCTFDPGTLACSAGETANCLTPSEVAAVRKIYNGARNPRTGEQIFPGWVRGSELGWGGYFVGLAEPARIDFWRYWVFHNPQWNPNSFDFDKDLALADRELAQIASKDPDLSAFRKHGGKILAYQGWADPVVPPENIIHYYEAVGRAVGDTSSFFRLFMVPGMSHCGGGPGASQFDSLQELDRWVVEGKAPDHIMATHNEGGKVDATRLLCPWPQAGRWNGEQFVCAAH